MRTLIALTLLIAATAVGAQTNTSFACTWASSPSVFVGPTNVLPALDRNFIYITSDLTLPLSQWTLLGSTPGSVIQPGSSNYVAVTSAVFTVSVPAANFYFGTAVYSNSAGVVPFSLNNVGVAQMTAFPTVLRSFQKQ